MPSWRWWSETGSQFDPRGIYSNRLGSKIAWFSWWRSTSWIWVVLLLHWACHCACLLRASLSFSRTFLATTHFFCDSSTRKRILVRLFQKWASVQLARCSKWPKLDHIAILVRECLAERRGSRPYMSLRRSGSHCSSIAKSLFCCVSFAFFWLSLCTNISHRVKLEMLWKLQCLQ